MEGYAQSLSQPDSKTASEKHGRVAKIPKRCKKKRKRFASLEGDHMDSNFGDVDINEGIEMAGVSEKRRKVSSLSHIQLPGLIYPRSAYRCDEVPPLHTHLEEEVLQEFMVCEGTSW